MAQLFFLALLFVSGICIENYPVNYNIKYNNYPTYATNPPARECNPGATKNNCQMTCTCTSDGHWGCVDTCPLSLPGPNCQLVPLQNPVYPNCCPKVVCAQVAECKNGAVKNDCNAACKCVAGNWQCVDACPAFIPPTNCRLINRTNPVYPDCCPIVDCECKDRNPKCQKGDVCNNCNKKCTCVKKNQWDCDDTCPKVNVGENCYLQNNTGDYLKGQCCPIKKCPCAGKDCQSPKICTLNNNNKAICVCPDVCADIFDPVCVNGVEYPNACRACKASSQNPGATVPGPCPAPQNVTTTTQPSGNPQPPTGSAGPTGNPPSTTTQPTGYPTQPTGYPTQPTTTTEYPTGSTEPTGYPTQSTTGYETQPTTGYPTQPTQGYPTTQPTTTTSEGGYSAPYQPPQNPGYQPPPPTDYTSNGGSNGPSNGGLPPPPPPPGALIP